MIEFSRTLVIIATPAAVIDAFFDQRALAIWWGVKRSLCVPRPLGSYAVEWDPTEWKDDLLGRLGGALHGTVVEYKAGREFFLADAYWLPPEGDPVGPMALEATCSRHAWGAELHVRQSGFEESPRWRRYYEVITPGWETALSALKDLLEKGAAR
ncbi:MAG: SRPBCC domain-containing protein [Acidimicrobiia bacterium]|nr:SRPBCC domain-containing protein [Acidimicrobiia bacterium]